MENLKQFMVVSSGHVSFCDTREKALRHASKLEMSGFFTSVFQKVKLNCGYAYVLIYSTEKVEGGE